MRRTTYSKPFMAVERFKPQEFVAGCVEEISVNLLPTTQTQGYYKCDGWDHNDHDFGTKDGYYDNPYEEIQTHHDGESAKKTLEALMKLENPTYSIVQVYGTSSTSSLGKSYSSSYFKPYVAVYSGLRTFSIIAEGYVDGTSLEDYFTKIVSKNQS